MVKKHPHLRQRSKIKTKHPLLPSFLLADDDQLPVMQLISLRIMPLLVGLVLGFIVSFIVSRFQEVLSKNIEVAYFLPFIVYMADAVGAQTQTIATRDLSGGTAVFSQYLIKETIIGILLGLFFGAISWLVVMVWFSSAHLASAVGLSMLGAVSVAPLSALLVTTILNIEKIDPAVGAGPIGTVIQDTISVIIYGSIASAVLLT